MNTSISPKVIPNRIVVFAKDVMNITGKKESAARDLLRRIKMKHHKTSRQFVTLHEFCSYTGLQVDDVQCFLI